MQHTTPHSIASHIENLAWVKLISNHSIWMSIRNLLVTAVNVQNVLQLALYMYLRAWLLWRGSRWSSCSRYWRWPSWPAVDPGGTQTSLSPALLIHHRHPGLPGSWAAPEHASTSQVLGEYRSELCYDTTSYCDGLATFHTGQWKP